MKLTSYTDYALRTLMHLAEHDDGLVTIRDVAETQGIAHNHLTKVVHHLGVLGVVETVRGRHGGLRLGRRPEEINIGQVVRHTEQDFAVAECFEMGNNNCLYSTSCRLKGALGRATRAFLDVLDGVSLAELVASEGAPCGGAQTRPVALHAGPAGQRSEP